MCISEVLAGKEQRLDTKMINVASALRGTPRLAGKSDSHVVQEVSKRKNYRPVVRRALEKSRMKLSRWSLGGKKDGQL